jgi:polyphosphate kinase 2 (PPK2 family)
MADSKSASNLVLVRDRRWPGDQNAYAAASARCSTAGAPWYVVPANRNWYRNWAVSWLIETMEDMKLTYPNPHLDVRALKKTLPAVA